MTYKDQFVVEVKVNGQILRVRNGSVYLPFGCEYSILLKNLNSRKASVKISIDGEDVLDGNSLIVHPLVTHELQGYLNGNIAKNRFRFIQKTKQIQDHRGDRVGDGLLRVEFAFEKKKPEPKIINEIHHYHNHYDSFWIGSSPFVYNNNRDFNLSDSITYSASSDSIKCSSDGILKSSCFNNTLGYSGELNVPLSDEGITVKGNEINEHYNYTCVGELEQSSVIIIELKGVHNSPGVEVQEPITVKTKLVCSSCGTKSTSSFKFCPQCGTFLG